MAVPDWVTTILCPLIGVLINNLMWYLPLSLVLDCNRKNTVGTLNPLTFLALLFSTLSWSIYGLLLGDFFVFFSSALGVVWSLFYSMTALRLLVIHATIEKNKGNDNRYIFNSDNGGEVGTTILGSSHKTRSRALTLIPDVSYEEAETHVTRFEQAFVIIFAFWMILSLFIGIVAKGSSAAITLVGSVCDFASISYYAVGPPHLNYFRSFVTYFSFLNRFH